MGYIYCILYSTISTVLCILKGGAGGRRGAGLMYGAGEYILTRSNQPFPAILPPLFHLLLNLFYAAYPHFLNDDRKKRLSDGEA